MAVTSTTFVRVASAMALFLSACGDDDSSDPAISASTGEETTEDSADPTVLPTTTSLPEDDAGDETAAQDTDADDSDDSDDTKDGGAACDIYGQDCADGEKCTPYSDQPDLVPDDLRCCPIVGGSAPGQPGDTCIVEDYFGSCLDDCAAGSFCLDIDGDGQGVCQPFCRGSADAPECESDQTCFVYFAGTPMCFDNCDPLAQDCPDDQGCYPDANAAGGTGFICLPQIGSQNTYGDFCWLLSNCAAGFICVTPEFLPSCDGPVGCCTALCDITDSDDCAENFDAQLECTSWYLNGQVPPAAALENVGVCILPP